MMKIFAFGVRGFFQDAFNRIDFVLVVLTFIVSEIYQNKTLRLVRTVRLLRFVSKF